MLGRVQCSPVTGLRPSALFVSSLGLVVSVAASTPLVAQSLPSCSVAVTNGTCVVALNRDSPSSPLAIRLSRRAGVRLVVDKRPLDDITVDVALTDVAPADPVAAILGAFVPVIKLVTFDAHLVGGLKGQVVPLSTAQFVLGVGAATSTPALDVLKELQWIDSQQAALAAELAPSKITLDTAGSALQQFEGITIEGWRTRSLGYERDRLVTTLRQTASSDTGTGLASGLHAAADQATKDFAKLATTNPLPSPDDLKGIGTLLNDVATNQSTLDAASASLVAAKAASGTAADALQKLDLATALLFTQDIDPAASAHDRIAKISVSSQDRLTKKATSVATVVLNWGDSRWEVSAGALLSALKNRSFQNSPDIVDGQVQLDASGKTNTIVTETDNRPSVVPFALAHFRMAEASGGYDKRLAFSLSGGMGVNPNSGSADFAAGFSVSYGALVISPLAHFGRDSRLTNGLEIGASLGSSPPTLPVERFWTVKFAVAVTARIF
jgi:hypothetical protein